MKNIWLSFVLNGSIFSIIFLLASMNSRVTKLPFYLSLADDSRNPSMFSPKFGPERGTKNWFDFALIKKTFYPQFDGNDLSWIRQREKTRNSDSQYYRRCVRLAYISSLLFDKRLINSSKTISILARKWWIYLNAAFPRAYVFPFVFSAISSLYDRTEQKGKSRGWQE